MKIEKYVPNGKELLNYIVETAIADVTRESKVSTRYLIATNNATATAFKEEIKDKKRSCIKCAEDIVIVEWIEENIRFTMSISVKGEACSGQNVFKVYYILANGLQLYRYVTTNPDEIVVFKIKV